jgi:alkylation response protein AidB-like acyl-CoA dehydrogenase
MKPALVGGTPAAALRHDCELWWLTRVQPIFGGTTEIQKEIISRSLGL